MVANGRCFEMEWAKIHLDRLEEHYSGLVGNPAKVYAITIEEDAERGVVRIKSETIGAHYILQVGLVAGDFICNLRAALDHLAWELAAIGKKRRSSETCFPVCVRDSPSTQAKIAAATKGIPAGAVAIMKSLQPYTAGKAYKSHHLWRLNFLWNVNKHRTIALHTADSGVLFEVPPGIHREARELNGQTIVTIPLSAKNKVRFNPRPDVAVTFGDEERGIQLSLQDLRDIYEFVCTKVVPPLARFLP